MSEPVGFVGLGSIGLPIALNIAESGFSVIGHDTADPARWAQSPIQPMGSNAEVAQRADTVLLSLPDADAVKGALAQFMAAPQRRVHTVIDLSTIGATAARAFAKTVEAAGGAYVDAPVSGGVRGVKARTLAIMCACPKAVFVTIENILRAISSKVFHVGEEPGQGQALKLANNFLSATALAATCEAALFGLANGLDLDVMMDVLKASSGRNSAVEEKFPKFICKGKFNAGFRNTLMSKDVSLYAREAKAAGCHGDVARLVERMWREFTEALPDRDTTVFFPYLQ